MQEYTEHKLILYQNNKIMFHKVQSFVRDDKKPPRNFFRGGTICYRVGRSIN